MIHIGDHFLNFASKLLDRTILKKHIKFSELCIQSSDRWGIKPEDAR
jgi:hypothetical protein